MGHVNLHENWNRYYDPRVGRYLTPEPNLQLTGFALSEAKGGRNPPVYSYAYNNPLFFVDPDGLGPKNIKLINCMVQCGLPVDRETEYCLADARAGDPKQKNPKKKKTAAFCQETKKKLIQECNAKCEKENPEGETPEEEPTPIRCK